MNSKMPFVWNILNEDVDVVGNCLQLVAIKFKADVYSYLRWICGHIMSRDTLVLFVKSASVNFCGYIKHNYWRSHNTLLDHKVVCLC